MLEEEPGAATRESPFFNKKKGERAPLVRTTLCLPEKRGTAVRIGRSWRSARQARDPKGLREIVFAG